MMTAAQDLERKAKRRLAERARVGPLYAGPSMSRPRRRRWRPNIADLLVPAPARLTRERAANRRRVARLQAAGAARDRRPRREGYFCEEERNQLLDEYDGLVRRLVSRAVSVGLAPFIERGDLEGRLRLELAALLDKYCPKRGVGLDGYLAEHLKYRLRRILGEERWTDGIVCGPSDRGNALSAERGEGILDVATCGYRSGIEGWDENGDDALSGARADAGPTFEADGEQAAGAGAVTRPKGRRMVSWAELQRREAARILAVDVRAAMLKLRPFERRLVQEWMHGDSQREISERAGLAQQDVSEYLSELRAKLHALLRDYSPQK